MVIITVELLILKFLWVKDLHALSSEKGVFLVLHGASGLCEELIKVNLL